MDEKRGEYKANPTLKFRMEEECIGVFMPKVPRKV